MTKMAEEEFTPVKLAPSYAFLLMTVNKSPGIHPIEISKTMMLQPSTVTRLIEKMERLGYLERVIEGKYTHVYPRKASLELDGEIKRCWHNLLKRYESAIGKKKSKQVTADVYQAAITLS